MSKPDTKTIVIQAADNNKVCPRSGWLIKIITISNKTKKEYKYLLWTLIFSFRTIVLATKIINNGFTNFYPSLLVVSALCVCLYLMSHTMKFIPVGIVYASWAGLGIVGITIIAVIKYKQIPNIPTIIGLSLIVVGVAIVHLMNDIDVK